MIAFLGLSFVTANDVSAAEPCTAENIRWAHSSNRIYITGDVECTLTEIKALGSASMPLELVNSTDKIWFLGANIFIQDKAKLVLRGDSISGDVNELRLKSNNTSDMNNFVIIQSEWGTIDIDGVKITSWDENAAGPDTEYATYKRAYIKVRSSLATDGVTPEESRMDIKNSDVGYLGYDGAEAYGLSWKVLGSTSSDKAVFNIVGVYGDVLNNKIHHNYFGLYTYGAEAMTFIGNEVYENTKYGIDPHDDSDYLLIQTNYAHNNGSHGIICSQRCNNLTVKNNNSSNNGGVGIMLHRNANDSLVENNQLNNNVDSGIAIFDSNNNQIASNTVRHNGKGIRFSVGSSNNIVENNDFSENLAHGMYFYQGSDIPTENDGRIRSNVFRNNTVNANGLSAARIKEADSNIFEDNNFTNNGSYAIYIENANSNTFEGNTLTGNVLNYYYAKSALNTIQDSDSFAVKIGDSLSIMTIIDSENSIFKNSKKIATDTYSSSSSITLNKANAGNSVVTFERLNFTVIPSSNNLAIKINRWKINDDFYKTWAAKNDTATAISVSYKVGDLSPGADYNVIVDGTFWNTFTADGSGEINFIYDGIFQNRKIFELKNSP